MRTLRLAAPPTAFALVLALAMAGCGAPDEKSSFVAPTSAPAVAGPGDGPAPQTARPAAKATKRGVARILPRPGNLDGKAAVPAEAAEMDTSQPSQVIGTGTPASCTSDAVVAAVEAGGIITFNCGPAPAVITMTRTAKIKNAASVEVVLDGGGKVTLSGDGKRRILYMNTCDRLQGFTTSHCQDQDHPRLTVQNLVFADGNSTGDPAESGGGGAIFVRGGRFKAVNTRFVGNRCDDTGPDSGGAALRVLSQFHHRPVYLVRSTFSTGSCSNGGALGSIDVSWVVLNSVLNDNWAIGRGANPARPGTPGGGSGGAIYADGNAFTVTLAGTLIENNHAAEGGGAVFFVSNDRTGTMLIDRSRLWANPSDGFETAGFPGIFFLGSGNPAVTGSTLK